MRNIPTELETRRRVRLRVPLVLWFLVVGVSIFGYSAMKGYVDLDRMVDSLWPYHDRMTTVLYTTWAKGEYKTCSAGNEETSYVLLKCAEVDASKVGGIFTVRFKGRIYVSELRKDWLDWKCRNDGDSAKLKITCWPLT